MAEHMDRSTMEGYVPVTEEQQLAVVRAMVEHSPLAMAITAGASHTLRGASPAFRNLLPSEPTTSLQGCVGDLLAPASWASVQPLLDRVFASGVAEVAADLEEADPAQGTRYWTYIVWPVTAPDGHAAGLMLQASETTEQVHTQQRDAQTGRQLRAVNEQLLIAGLREQAAHDEIEAALTVRDQFLTVASHELRTPLTSLLGYAHLLQRKHTTGPLPEAQQTRMLDLVVRQAMRLRMLMGQVFDVTSLQQGQFALVRQPMDLGALVARIVDEFRLSLETDPTPASIVLHAGAETLIVAGDADRLEQVVLNLLGNAVKYSPAGSPIVVQVGREETQAVLEVIDGGIGIPAVAQAHLFESFFRAGNVGHVSGLGIGLHVVAEIVARHDGYIAVESTEGQGSTFRVMLPLAAPNA